MKDGLETSEVMQKIGENAKGAASELGFASSEAKPKSTGSCCRCCLGASRRNYGGQR